MEIQLSVLVMHTKGSHSLIKSFPLMFPVVTLTYSDKGEDSYFSLKLSLSSLGPDGLLGLRALSQKETEETPPQHCPQGQRGELFVHEDAEGIIPSPLKSYFLFSSRLVQEIIYFQVFFFSFQLRNLGK